jgi:hypothetical protein
MTPETAIEQFLSKRVPARFARIFPTLGHDDTGPYPQYLGVWKYCVILLILYSVAFVGLRPVTDDAWLGGDIWEYQAMAVNFANGHGLKVGSILPYEEYRFSTLDKDTEHYKRYKKRFLEAGEEGGRDNFYRTAGYPVFLAALYKLFGVHPALAKHIQLFLLVVIAASLPALGNALGGRRGFYAGLLGGFLFLAMKSYMANRIMTEALMSFSVFLSLLLWLAFNKHRKSIPLAVIFGVSLTSLLLVKGIFIFVPPLFYSYMFLETFFWKRYKRKIFCICLASFALTLLPYSVYVSIKTDSVVLLSTQSKNVMLDGNNEESLHSGKWNKQWHFDENSFYNKKMRETGNESSLFLLKEFYKVHYKNIPWIIRNKLHDGFRKDFMLEIFAILLFLTNVLVFFRKNYKALALFSIVAVVSYFVLFFFLRSFFVTGLVMFLGTIPLFALDGSLLSRASAFWKNTTLMGISLIFLNFFIITILLFGDLRFILPINFLFYPLVFYMLFTLADIVLKAREQRLKATS